MSCYYKKKDVLYLIMPDHDEALNREAIRQVQFYAPRWKFHRVCIFACQNNQVLELLEEISAKTVHNDLSFELKVLSDKSMGSLMNKLSKRSDAMGRSIYDNVLIFTFGYYNDALNMIYQNGLMNLKALVCRRMIHMQNKYADVDELP